MEPLKFTLIKDQEQYNKYCDILEDLISQDKKEIQDEIELLTLLLIEKWDNEHNSFDDLYPIELLKALMEEHDLNAKDLTGILDLGVVMK